MLDMKVRMVSLEPQINSDINALCFIIKEADTLVSPADKFSEIRMKW